jgi:hypothetical protein
LYVSDRDDTGTYHNNATDLLRIFSGFKQTRDATTPPDGTLAEFVNPNFVDSQQLAILAKQKITPYARTGGALTSGTASSFYGGMHYKDIDTNLTPNQLDALSAGNYGKDYPVHETDEANSRA